LEFIKEYAAQKQVQSLLIYPENNYFSLSFNEYKFHPIEEKKSELAQKFNDGYNYHQAIITFMEIVSQK